MKIGAQAELAAADYLTRHGLQLVVQNYRCRFGEIDLILKHGDTLVFAEVRLRNNKNYGGAAASIDSHKQHKLISTAQHYLTRLAHIPPCRFDAVLMKYPVASAMSPDPDLPVKFLDSDFEWIRNAFSA